ncbi:hypothetical protein SAY87_003550 [Trapa incisa]|uniref:Uncharacterized protein n=1 Tax=Trapa incisa TaxID=236973 RepID=A0AAN7QI47_9MYRT|nr:hypothetical protein SAY87_003550 [Trapa incisa]
MIHLIHVVIKGVQDLVICGGSWVKLKLAHLGSWMRSVIGRLHRYVFLYINSFLLQLFYLVFLSILGFWLLVMCRVMRRSGSWTTAITHVHGGSSSSEDDDVPRSLDLLFTSVSAATVSSMSTVEMEAFSNAQLFVLTFLMLVGGEVFISTIGLHLKRCKLRMMMMMLPKSDHGVREAVQAIDCERNLYYRRYLSFRFLASAVLVYQVAVQLLGLCMVAAYLWVVNGARDVLKRKGLNAVTFTIFTVVSTFSGCGFLPTNENMMVFRRNSGLLLILIPQSLLGNALFPSCLRFCLWVVRKCCCFKLDGNGDGTSYLLGSTGISEVRYLHLLPGLHSRLLVATVLGFIGIQSALFVAMQRGSEGLAGLSPIEKVVAILFQCVNTRHTGETVVDLSKLVPPILVLFVAMMYLPPYTTFLPVKGSEGELSHHDDREMRKPPRYRGNTIENLLFSQLTYLVIFIILVCITEREKMKEDPLNFNVFNIVVEVTSAYRNVGFSMGYGCSRQLEPEARCTDKWYGFSGKWSDQGKIVLMVVMVFGRMMKFNMHGGRAWKLM